MTRVLTRLELPVMPKSARGFRSEDSRWEDNERSREDLTSWWIPLGVEGLGVGCDHSRKMTTLSASLPASEARPMAASASVCCDMMPW
jgi:hypothetical protein